MAGALVAGTTALVVYAVLLASRIAQVIAVVAPVLVLWLLVAAFFRWATLRKEGRRAHSFRGATLTVLLWLVVSGLFSYYVSTLSSYSKFYGGLATVVVLMVWLWLMAFALLAGGALNALIEKRFQRSAQPSA